MAVYKKITEACELFYLHFAVRFYEGLQQRRVRKCFYQDPGYRSLDRALIKGPNPYRLKEAFPYGETPLCSLKQIADHCGLTKEDLVVDLGCGRGRGVFFLAHHYRCRVHGIDKIEPFIKRAEQLLQEHPMQNVSFTCGDMRDFDFKSSTFIFFYGTTFSEEFVTELIARLNTLPQGAKIVTVSYPLEGFRVLDQFEISFPWGIGEVFLQTK
jgi:SAM-dependent methyltransferase